MSLSSSKQLNNQKLHTQIEGGINNINYDFRVLVRIRISFISQQACKGIWLGAFKTAPMCDTVYMCVQGRPLGGATGAVALGPVLWEGPAANGIQPESNIYIYYIPIAYL